MQEHQKTQQGLYTETKHDNIFWGKRILCLCASPFQVLSLISMFADRSNQCFAYCDCLIDISIPEAETITARIEEEGIFSRVICARGEVEESFRHLGTKWMFNKSFRYAMRDRILRSFPELEEENYDILVCSSVTNTSLALRYFFAPFGFTVLYDDGLGSHEGNLFKLFAFQDDIINLDYVSSSFKDKVRRIAKKTLSKHKAFDCRFDARAIYLFNPSLKEERTYANVQIKPITLKNSQELLCRIMPNSSQLEQYKKVDYIYLTTSNTCNDSVKQSEILLVQELMEKLGSSFGIRIHPNRDKSDFDKCKEAILPSEGSWELMLLTGTITEDKYLIGLGSSAQFHPKRLFDMEPRVIFVHSVLGNQDNPSYNVINKAAEKLRRDYSRSERVVIPNNREMLFISIMNDVSKDKTSQQNANFR